MSENNGHSNGIVKSEKRGLRISPGLGRPNRDFGQYVRDWLEHGDSKRLKKAMSQLLRCDPKVLLYYGYGKPAEAAAEIVEVLTLDERKRRVGQIFGLAVNE